MKTIDVAIFVGCLSVVSDCFLIDDIKKLCNYHDCNDHGTAELHHLRCVCNCQDGWTGDRCSEEKNAAITTTTTTTTTTPLPKTATTLKTTLKALPAPLTTIKPPSSTTTVTYSRCYAVQTLLDLSSETVSTNANASSCTGTDHAGSEAFVMKHCNVDIPMLWKPGAKVIDFCDSLPNYIPISSFKNGMFNAKLTEAAIFLGCNQNGMKIGIQTCDHGPRIVNCKVGGLGTLNADLYYIIQ